MLYQSHPCNWPIWKRGHQACDVYPMWNTHAVIRRAALLYATHKLSCANTHDFSAFQIGALSSPNPSNRRQLGDLRLSVL